jgi:hypothetical protein
MRGMGRGLRGERERERARTRSVSEIYCAMN